MKSQLITKEEQTTRLKDCAAVTEEERWRGASETAGLFPWKVTVFEQGSAGSFCRREEASGPASDAIIDGFAFPGTLLERAA